MKNRKALSSVVGTVFAIIALATVITYVTFSMNTLEQFNQEVMVKNTEIIDQAKEEFNVVTASIRNSKFNITIQNTGELPINITRLWISNKTDPSWGTAKYDINIPISPGKVATNIGQNIALTALSTKAYEIKMTTERGNAEEVAINSPSQEPLYLQVYALPESVPTEFTTTVLFQVTNNMSNNNLLIDLKPNALGVSTACQTTCSATFISGPVPSSYASLKYGDTATFKWIYNLQGSAGDTATFTASLINGLNSAAATTTLKDIVLALESGTAISTQGLDTPVQPDNMLFFHEHNPINFPATPSYLDKALQMSPAGPDELGTSENIDEVTTRDTLGFFTNNSTSYTIGIPQGTWNASLRYSSERMPPEVTHNGEGHIYHFNSNRGSDPTYPLWDNSIQDCYEEQSGASNEPSSSENPDWLATYGVNGSAGGVYFDGDDYYTSDHDDDCVNPDEDGNDNFFAVWFKADPDLASNARKYIMWISNSTSTDYWRIYLLGTAGGANHGRLYFEVKSGDSSTVGSCSTNISGQNGLMNGKWQHIVATKDEAVLQLYLNGTSQGGCVNVGDADVRNNPDCGQNCQIYIGSDNQDNLNFKGYMDDVIWAVDNTLNNNQAGVNALINGFGDGAHKYRFKMEITDKNGQNPVTVIDSQNYGLPFKDFESYSTSTSTDGDRDIVWAGFNYTTGVIGPVNVQRNQRVLFSMYYQDGIGFNLREDDINLDGSSDPWSSYVQHPKGNATFPSFFQYDTNNDLQIWVYNQGPYGSWFTYQGTRAVFNHETTTASYAALVRGANGTDSDHLITEHRDSLFIPVNYVVELTFFELRQRPSTSSYYSGTYPEITPGYYHAYLFIDGFDELGEKFLRQMDLGIVSVCTGCLP